MQSRLSFAMTFPSWAGEQFCQTALQVSFPEEVKSGRAPGNYFPHTCFLSV